MVRFNIFRDDRKSKPNCNIRHMRSVKPFDSLKGKPVLCLYGHVLLRCSSDEVLDIFIDN